MSEEMEERRENALELLNSISPKYSFSEQFDILFDGTEMIEFINLHGVPSDLERIVKDKLQKDTSALAILDLSTSIDIPVEVGQCILEILYGHVATLLLFYTSTVQHCDRNLWIIESLLSEIEKGIKATKMLPSVIETADFGREKTWADKAVKDAEMSGKDIFWPFGEPDDRTN